MSVDIPDALDRMGAECPVCGEPVEDLMMVEEIGLVLKPCGHVVEP